MRKKSLLRPKFLTILGIFLKFLQKAIKMVIGKFFILQNFIKKEAKVWYNKLCVFKSFLKTKVQILCNELDKFNILKNFAVEMIKLISIVLITFWKFSNREVKIISSLLWKLKLIVILNFLYIFKIFSIGVIKILCNTLHILKKFWRRSRISLRDLYIL